MPLHDDLSLWGLTVAAGLSPSRFVADRTDRILLADLAGQTERSEHQVRFLDKSILVGGRRQLPVVQALLSLDGIARRILLAPEEVPFHQLQTAVAAAEIDLVVSDGLGPPRQLDNIDHIAAEALYPKERVRLRQTEWMLFTSGTTGCPKVAVHSLSSLTGPVQDGLGVSKDVVWSTFYDVRRYGGLTILFRALVGGGSLVLSQPGESVNDFLARAGSANVTHISGTPSHWRRALMTGSTASLSPRYVRMSGEIADQTILSSLAAAFPNAAVAHAFASTEAGFAFDVGDGLAGFPADIIGRTNGGVTLKIQDGTLRIRSGRAAFRYLDASKPLADADGFIDTGDRVEQHGDRFFFIGRREGVINVGGHKVHPEEVEAVINRHPAVQMARVRGQPNSILGAIVVADVVIHPSHQAGFAKLEADILAHCRLTLPAYKVPSFLREVSHLDISGSGKMARA